MSIPSIRVLDLGSADRARARCRVIVVLVIALGAGVGAGVGVSSHKQHSAAASSTVTVAPESATPDAVTVYDAGQTVLPNGSTAEVMVTASGDAEPGQSGSINA